MMYHSIFRIQCYKKATLDKYDKLGILVMIVIAFRDYNLAEDIVLRITAFQVFDNKFAKHMSLMNFVTTRNLQK